MPCATDYQYDRALQFVTRVACEMARVLTRGGSIADLTQEAKDWIRKHNEEDARRQTREAAARAYDEARMRLIGSLTPEQRRILGLE